MCTYSITLNDELVKETRRSFSDETSMDVWLQRQVELLLMEFNAKQAAKSKARLAIEAMRRQSEANGNADMSIEDINKEIRLYRDSKKKVV